VALVTGASRGIGAQIAALFSASGRDVMLSSRKQMRSKPPWTRCADARRLEVFAANAGDGRRSSLCRRHRRAIRAGRHPGQQRCDQPVPGSMIDIDLPRLDKTHDVNLRGPFVWIQECWRRSMQEHGG
jgi:NAD(P)-dependent dehydrogenase (short-subunit alcohol dehydrogenase family)